MSALLEVDQLVKQYTLPRQRLLGRPPLVAALQGVSTALQLGSSIWVGSFNDDRVGYFTRQ